MQGAAEALQLFQQFPRDCETVKTVLDKNTDSNTLPKQGVNEKARKQGGIRSDRIGCAAGSGDPADRRRLQAACPHAARVACAKINVAADNGKTRVVRWNMRSLRRPDKQHAIAKEQQDARANSNGS